MVSTYSDTEHGAASDSQRIQRSEFLLSQLYRTDVKPRFVLPDLRLVKVLAYFSLLALVLFSGTLFYKFNNFILMREDVLSKASNMESAIQRRSNLFSNLINLTLNHASLEHSVFTNTAQTRSEIIKQSDLSAEVVEKLVKFLGKAGLGAAGKDALPTVWNKALEALRQGGNMGASLGRLLAVVEQYPNIQSAKTYIEMMKSLVDMEDRIATRRIEYNAVSRIYNTEISKFPWKLLANWTEFKRAKYFSADDKGAAAPVLTFEVYKQLMPYEFKGEHKK